MARHIEKTLKQTVAQNERITTCITALQGYKLLLDPRPRKFPLESHHDVSLYVQDMKTIARDAHKELTALRTQLEEQIHKMTKKKDYIRSETYYDLISAIHEVKWFEERCTQYERRHIGEHKLATSLDRLLNNVNVQ